MHHRSFRIWLLAAAAPFAPSIAAAQSSTSAQALFDDARVLMSAGRHAEACPKLAESQRLDPGGGTLIHLALCYEHVGKSASAWATFNDALSAAKRDRRDDRLKVAEEHLAQLTPKLTKLRLVVPPQIANTKGLVIRRGEDETSPAEWGSAVPVDPGEIRVVLSAPGKKTKVQTVVADRPGQTLDVEVSALENAPDATAGGPGIAVQSDAGVRSSSGGGQRTIGLVVAGVGLVGLGVGGYFGLQSLSKKKDADAYCDGAACREHSGVDLRDDARGAGNISTVAFIAGGVAVAAGATLYLTAPKKNRTSVALRPALAPGYAGLGATGRW